MRRAYVLLLTVLIVVSLAVPVYAGIKEALVGPLGTGALGPIGMLVDNAIQNGALGRQGVVASAANNTRVALNGKLTKQDIANNRFANFFINGIGGGFVNGLGGGFVNGVGKIAVPNLGGGYLKNSTNKVGIALKAGLTGAGLSGVSRANDVAKWLRGASMQPIRPVQRSSR